ncbi:MAG: prefoldin subunit alpha [ANME-2 cluster archaeon]|nr:prefoldin subunit alpha [ANME-2 cluster archaeon]
MASHKPLSEQDIQNMAVQHQQMQYQAESAVQQLNFVGDSINDVTKAINTLTEFEGVNDGHEVFLPIGAGVNVKANLVTPENVVIQVGAGISVEKNIAQAKTMLDDRREELTKYQGSIQNSLNELTNRMKEIETVLNSVARQQKAETTSSMQGS